LKVKLTCPICGDSTEEKNWTKKADSMICPVCRESTKQNILYEEEDSDEFFREDLDE
jgi:NAD-dependent SIR2 family protein deacetylase